MTYKEIEKRIDELEKQTQRLLYQSTKTHQAAKEIQYEIQKLKDELNTRHD